MTFKITGRHRTQRQILPLDQMVVEVRDNRQDVCRACPSHNEAFEWCKTASLCTRKILRQNLPCPEGKF